MSSPKIIKKIPLRKSENNVVKFQNVNEINFPKICIICGKNTENRYKRIVFGRSDSNTDYIVDYHLNIPLCNNCEQKIKIKRGLSSIWGKLLLVSSIINLILAIILYISTYSIFLSFGVFIIPFALLYTRYKAKTSNKVKLNDFLGIRLSKDKKTLIFDFLNEHYADFVKKVNSRKESSIQK